MSCPPFNSTVCCVRLHILLPPHFSPFSPLSSRRPSTCVRAARCSSRRRIPLLPPLLSGLLFFSLVLVGLTVELQALNHLFEHGLRAGSRTSLQGMVGQQLVAPVALFSVITGTLSFFWLLAACIADP